MSTPKMIFTYKRKRLSSRSGVEHADACPDSLSHVHTGIQQADPKESSEKDPMEEHKMTAPLITFSRRLRRKVDVGSSATSGELPAKEETKAVEKSSTLEVATDGIVTEYMSCQSSEKMLIKESRESSYLGTRSSAGIPMLRETVDEKCSRDNMVVDASSGTKQSSSTLSGLDAMETANPLKNKVSRSSDDELSSCVNVCKTDEHRALNQCLTSSGDSQLTSVAFAIDCNVIPEPDLQVKESDIIQHFSAIPENRGNVTEEGYLKRKDLKLFGDTNLKDVDSPSCGALRLHDDPHAPVAINKEPETLQLFPVNGQSSQSAPKNVNLESDYRRPRQTSRNAPAIGGPSLATKPVYEGQTSRLRPGGPGMHLFQGHNVSSRGFVPNPAVQSFPHQSLLDTSNTSATVPRENRTNSLNRFQPGPPMWSEEELDSLWVGIRRHGLGNWHAMILDPKLRFAPWRGARDLAAQWEREEPKILIENSNRKRIPRGQIGAFMRHTLADMRAQCERIYQSNVQNQPHVHATSANRLGNYNATSFNSMHTSSVMVGGGGTGLGPNRPHLVQEPAMRLFEPFLDTPSTSPGVKDLNNYKFPGSTPHEIQPHNAVAGTSVKNCSTPENLIVIISDASSEETVSDEHIIPKFRDMML